MMDEQRKEIPMLPEGAVVTGRYKIVHQISRGGMGRVYLVEDMRLQGKLRALKLTMPLPGESDTFIREAGMLASLSHPQLPDIVDYCPPDAQGWAMIVMDYVSGETLGDLFERSRRRLPFRQICRYLIQLAEILVYLHGQQPIIVFRDLKPANVLIDRQDRAILVDFGIARTFRPDAAVDTERLGTPAFAAPEQFAGCQSDALSDLYSWGALAFYLLSGGQAAYRYAAGRHGKQLQPDVPPRFRDLLEWTLSPEPADRPRSAQQLSEQLRGILADLHSEQAIRADGTTSGNVKMAEQTEDHTGVSIVAIASAYPGAGATLTTLAISSWLSQCGVHHAIVECPGSEPELHALLNGGREMPKHAAYADPSGLAPSTPVWRREAAAYYPLNPLSAPLLPEARFPSWLRNLGVSIVLVDISSSWLDPTFAATMADWQLNSLWWVADCLPAKWTHRRQSAAEQLSRRMRQSGVHTGWIANRDHSFTERSDWLACFPEPPALRLPWYDAADIVQAVWQGEGFPQAGCSRQPSAFRKWLQAALGRASYEHFSDALKS